MSIKSICFSVLALLMFLGIIVCDIFLFRTQFIVGFLALFLLIIPFRISRSAIAEADGKIDKLIAQVIVPALALIGILFIILGFTIWS